MQIREIVLKSLLLFCLAEAAAQDRKNGNIQIMLPVSAAVSGLLVQIIAGCISEKDILAGTAVGFMLMLLSYASHESVGYGDGMMFIMSGIFLGLAGNVMLLLCSLILCTFGSVVMMAAGVKKRKDRIPFIPFMLFAYVLMLSESI